MKKILLLIVSFLIFISIFSVNSLAAADDCIKITVTMNGGGGWLNITKIVDMKSLNEDSKTTLTIANVGEEGVDLFFSVRNSSWKYMNSLQTEELIFIDEGETIEYEIVFDKEDEVEEVVTGPATMVLLELRSLVEDASIVVKGIAGINYNTSLIGGQLLDSTYTEGQVKIDTAVFGAVETPNNEVKVTATPTAKPTKKPDVTAIPENNNVNSTPTLDITHTIKPAYGLTSTNDNTTNLMPIAIIVSSVSLVVIVISLCATIIVKKIIRMEK